jgi:hypothetical protein
MTGSLHDHIDKDDDAVWAHQQMLDQQQQEHEADLILTRMGKGMGTAEDESTLRRMFNIPKREN